jgi:TonB family protein
MNRKSLILLAVMWALTAASQDTAQPQKLIQAANSASDLSSIRPYKLEALVIANPGTREEKRGKLTIFQDLGRSRSELMLAGYHEIDITIGDRRFVWRNSPASVAELRAMLDAQQMWRVNLAPADKFGTSFTTTLQGIPANCFEVTVERQTNRYCFDPVKNILVETALTETGKAKGRAVVETQYLDYQTVAGRQFPRAIRHLVAGKPDVNLEDLQVNSVKLDADLFMPPESSHEFETCEDKQPTRLLKRVDPEIPIMARMAHAGGDVQLSAIIEKDGTLNDLKVISGHPILAKAATDAVRQWRYSPAMCGSKAVATETELLIRFHM